MSPKITQSDYRLLSAFRYEVRKFIAFSEQAARAVVDDGRRAVDAGAAGHIFNLGHGVLPPTDPGLLTDLVGLVHSL